MKPILFEHRLQRLSGCCLLLCFLATTTFGQMQKSFSFVEKLADQSIEVYFNGQHLTSYLYKDELKKPVLYPLKTKNGLRVSRGYPLQQVPNERVDHQHHLGHWLNYGDVNGLDFWNNSSARPADRKHQYGEIRHQKLLKAKSGPQGELLTESHWVNHLGEILLKEKTQFLFSIKGKTFIIDRFTSLEAVVDINFHDNKEGMIAIRVAKGLELPSDRPALYTDAEGMPMSEKTVNTEGAYGDYLSSSGASGLEVWGTRAEWMRLSGKVEGKEVALAIIDHPFNPGYPTYWHARGYGLFSANPLGQKVFSKGKESLELALKAGESVAFKHRMLIHEGKLTPGRIDMLKENFQVGIE